MCLHVLTRRAYATHSSQKCLRGFTQLRVLLTPRALMTRPQLQMNMEVFSVAHFEACIGLDIGREQGHASTSWQIKLCGIASALCLVKSCVVGCKTDALLRRTLVLSEKVFCGHSTYLTCAFQIFVLKFLCRLQLLWLSLKVWEQNHSCKLTCFALPRAFLDCIDKATVHNHKIIRYIYIYIYECQKI